jgi:excinuclease ABC subunit A
VEHDKDIMMAADYLVDIGPKAGIYGGHIVAQGTPTDILKLKSDTALFLSGKKKIEIPSDETNWEWKMYSYQRGCRKYFAKS